MKMKKTTNNFYHHPRQFIPHDSNLPFPAQAQNNKFNCFIYKFKFLTTHSFLLFLLPFQPSFLFTLLWLVSFYFHLREKMMIIVNLIFHSNKRRRRKASDCRKKWHIFVCHAEISRRARKRNIFRCKFVWWD